MLGINWKRPAKMGLVRAFLLLLVAVIVAAAGASDGKLPVVINTWPFVDANTEGKTKRGNFRDHICSAKINVQWVSKEGLKKV